MRPPARIMTTLAPRRPFRTTASPPTSRRAEPRKTSQAAKGRSNFCIFHLSSKRVLVLIAILVLGPKRVALAAGPIADQNRSRGRQWLIGGGVDFFWKTKILYIVKSLSRSWRKINRSHELKGTKLFQRWLVY